MENLVMSVLGESRGAQVIQAKEEPEVSSAQRESRGIEVQLESEEYQGQKESLASLVQMAVREYLDFQGPRVFRGKVGLQVMLAHKDFLVYRVLMAKKESVAQRVSQVTQVL